MKICASCSKEMTINAFLPRSDDVCISCRVSDGLVLCEVCADEWFGADDNWSKHPEERVCRGCAEEGEESMADIKDAMDEIREERADDLR